MLAGRLTKADGLLAVEVAVGSLLLQHGAQVYAGQGLVPKLLLGELGVQLRVQLLNALEGKPPGIRL